MSTRDIEWFAGHPDAVHIKKGQRDRWAKELIERARGSDPIDCHFYTGSGDTMVFVFLNGRDSYADVYDCKVRRSGCVRIGRRK